MHPYQEASQAIRKGNEYPIHLLKNAGLTAIGGGAARLGSAAVSKLLPSIGALISQYIPDDLSMKGLGKIDPRFNKFIQGAIEEGYSYDDIRKFMGEKIEKSKKQEQPKENRNIIEQYSPELHQFIDQQLRGGTGPMKNSNDIKGIAGAAYYNKKFAPIIEKIQKDHNASWFDIVESIYGKKGTAPIQDQGQMQQGQPQQGGGQGGDEELFAAFQKALSL